MYFFLDRMCYALLDWLIKLCLQNLGCKKKKKNLGCKYFVKKAKNTQRKKLFPHVFQIFEKLLKFSKTSKKILLVTFIQFFSHTSHCHLPFRLSPFHFFFAFVPLPCRVSQVKSGPSIVRPLVPPPCGHFLNNDG